MLPCVCLLFLLPMLAVFGARVPTPFCSNSEACTENQECCNGYICINGGCGRFNESAEEGTSATDGSLVTWDQYLRAVTTIGYWSYPTPTREQYDILMRDAGPKGKITTKRELAMFLANVFHESGGMRSLEELGPRGPYGPYLPYEKDPSHPEREYYGRGYLTLRGYPVYREVSLGLYGDERFVENPNLVINRTVASDTAFWFWANKVHSQPGIAEGKSGVAANIITAGRECQGVPHPANEERKDIYTKLLKIFRVQEIPDYSGC